ncbi:TrmH family RNA methyltransferase [Pareuzebyella sediminis]|uniref:TrmH family RNA methyltransferase n=1 Tax=Pareuzebyella sediminis TaxID=2607998 RepID=UPI0011EE2DBB|nr:RNA methyltransferase [Pareuzebyella sediminis]
MADEKLLEYLENFISEQRKTRFLEILEQRTQHITVAIEDVYQLHNTSAVIRSCEAFGIQDVHVIENRFGKRLDKKIAMGAQQWVDVYRYKNTGQCIDTLRKEGYRIIATTPHKAESRLEDFDIDKKVALLFGTEREGLSKNALRESDGFMTIPMYGFTESLNISVSAAIILQHLTSRLKTSNVSWHLNGEQKLKKRLDWTKKSIKSIDDILDRYTLQLQRQS